MGKNRDLIIILSLVVVGMFIPFLGSMIINYGLNLVKIASTFGYFLLIFGIELGVVYLYFAVSNRVANRSIKKYNEK